VPPTTLEVEFDSSDAFLTAWNQEMSVGGLLLRGQSVSPAVASHPVQLRVRVNLSDRPIDPVVVEARVGAVTPVGVVLMFGIPPSELADLAWKLRGGSPEVAPRPPMIPVLDDLVGSDNTRREPAWGGARDSSGLFVSEQRTEPEYVAGARPASAPPEAMPAHGGTFSEAPGEPYEDPPTENDIGFDLETIANESTKNDDDPTPSLAPQAESAERPAPRATQQERLSALTVGQKINLALSGDREARMALIRDPNKTLHQHVLRNPRIGLDEVQYIAKLTTVSPDALVLIADDDEWGANPVICASLVRNPKTPLPVALRLLQRLPAGEIRTLARGGFRDAVVSAARKWING